jgi:hypothetical protein
MATRRICGSWLLDTATAQVYVLDDALRIEVQLPWILAALTGKIQGILKSNAEESLRIGHTPPKA